MNDNEPPRLSGDEKIEIVKAAFSDSDIIDLIRTGILPDGVCALAYQAPSVNVKQFIRTLNVTKSSVIALQCSIERYPVAVGPCHPLLDPLLKYLTVYDDVRAMKKALGEPIVVRYPLSMILNLWVKLHRVTRHKSGETCM